MPAQKALVGCGLAKTASDVVYRTVDRHRLAGSRRRAAQATRKAGPAAFWFSAGAACYLTSVRRRRTPWGAQALAFLCLLGWSAYARAEVLHIPIGGRPVPFGEGRVACEGGSRGFSAEPGGRMVRPPASVDGVGRTIELRVAPTFAACKDSTSSVTLMATGKLPEIDRGTVWFAADEGRLDAQGEYLQGATILWKSGDNQGSDTCNTPHVLSNGHFECSWSIARSLSVSPDETQFYVLPMGAHSLEDGVFFNAFGAKVTQERLRVEPSRVTLLRVVVPDAAVDLSTGQGEIPLTHPEAVASAECGALSCEMQGGKLIVRGASKAVSTLDVKLRLMPDVFIYQHDSFSGYAFAKLPVLHCPMAIVSGPPIRDNDDAKAIVRLSGRCGSDVGQLTFTLHDRPLKVLDLVRQDNESFVVLRLGTIHDEAVTLNAERGQTDRVVIASVYTPTRPPPSVRAVLELAERTNLNFIPNNRPAKVHVSPAGENLRFQILPIDGVYEVIETAGGSMIQADPNAAGLTSLRFGVRATNLPDRLNKVDLAIVVDPLQRGTGQANLPAPIEATASRPKPLVEVWCGGGSQPLHELQVGVTAHLPFKLRDTCRVVFHRELLTPEYGTQKLNFEIDILRVDGSAKPEGHVNEVVTLRHGDSPRYAWISGVTNPFERISVRVSHVADENHYLGAEEVRTGAPAAQWSAVLGTGRVRLYGTTTIPTGLYRFARSHQYSGVLALNLGVISRLTWLDEEGHEGLVGAEAGILVFGLANYGASGQPNTQIGAVLGLGLAVPIANRGTPTQAAINLHAWLEINLTGGGPDGGRYALIFGPSISIGSVGVNL